MALNKLSIALDAMGGDHGLPVTVPAALDSLEQHPGLEIILVGDQPSIERALASHTKTRPSRLLIRHASETVDMDESPALALRHKKDSSMRVAIDLVKSGEAHAAISAGNTGALMAIARFVLKTLPGIDRPAIVVAMPTAKGIVQMLDLGANIDCTPQQLFQFAVMGSVLVSEASLVTSPRVALLNIGKEEIKGNELVRQTHALLNENTSLHLNYIGFIEADQIYSGNADVVVCDGFVGNIALKSIEGVAHVIAHFIKLEFNRNLFTKFCGLLSRPILKRAANRIDPRGYNGASLLGINGIVLKSHGGADRISMCHAIDQALLQIQKDIPSRIKHRVSVLVEAGSKS
jgi:glycerol-3-phosphate acyltransferase PlsX